MISWQVGRYEDRSEVVWNKKTAVADRRERSLRRGERGVSLASCESYSRPWPRTIPVSAWITGIKVFVPGRGILHNYPLLIPLAILNRTLSDFLLPRSALRAPSARARSGDQGKRACHVPEPCATRHWPVWTRRIYVVITTRAICVKIMSTWPVHYGSAWVDRWSQVLLLGFWHVIHQNCRPFAVVLYLKELYKFVFSIWSKKQLK